MKRVLVTGATRGLGLAICAELLSQGYHVVATGRKLTSELEELCQSANGSLHFFPFDFSDIDGIHSFVKNITKQHGNLYGLVNNAALGHDGVLATMHESQIRQLTEVNVLAPIVLTKYVSRSMLLNGAGRVINISSIIASTGFSGLSVYAATKAALSGFTKSLCRELGKANITVNTVAPGYMETDMTSGLEGKKLESIKRRSPSGELAKVENVASAVSYLLSEQAAMINGSTITVDAGSTA